MLKVSNEFLVTENGSMITPLKHIHMIRSIGDNLYFIDTRSGYCEQHPYKLIDLYKVFKSEGLDNFILIQDNTILNLDHVKSVYLEDDETAKDFSLFSCVIRNTPEEKTYRVAISLNTGWKEEIWCDSAKEAEGLYRDIDDKIIELKSSGANCD